MARSHNSGGTMKTIISFPLFMTLVLACAEGQAVAPMAKSRQLTQRARIVQNYGQLPLAFEQNLGQTDKNVIFLSRGSSYRLFLSPVEAVFALRESAREQPRGTRPKASLTSKTAVLRIKLIGANPGADISARMSYPQEAIISSATIPRLGVATFRNFPGCVTRIFIHLQTSSTTATNGNWSTTFLFVQAPTRQEYAFALTAPVKFGFTTAIWYLSVQRVKSVFIARTSINSMPRKGKRFGVSTS